MDLRALKRLTEGGEDLHLEFKLKVPDPPKLIREIIALANTDGGYLFIGVDDDGSVVGVKDPDEAEEVFRLALKKYCKPAPEFKLTRIPVTRKRTVVAIHLPPSRNKPHRFFEEGPGKRGITFYRIADRSVLASKELYFILKNRQKGTNVKFQFGEKEKILFEFLDSHEEISLRTFSRIANISPYTASRTLVILVSANVLEIVPGEGADAYRRPKNEIETL